MDLSVGNYQQALGFLSALEVLTGVEMAETQEGPHKLQMEKK